MKTMRRLDTDESAASCRYAIGPPATVEVGPGAGVDPSSIAEVISAIKRCKSSEKLPK